MKRALAIVVGLLGCGSPKASEETVARPEPWSDAWILMEAARYLDDADSRRSALEASLTDPSNVYSATRLSAYGLVDRGWDVLPEWVPRVATVDGPMVDAVRGERPLALPAGAGPIWSGVRPSSFEDWAALGRRVFFEYPLRPEPQAAFALANPGLAQDVGLVVAPDGTWPGVVAFEDVDGEAKIGITCALCHSTVEDGRLVEGRARRDLDYGRMRLAWHEGTGSGISEALAQRMARWGPGRADITADDDEDPVAIVDLWGLRGRTHLTQAATITHVGPAALAIRQETQILHANRERTRPPRELALALAVYLYALQTPEIATVDVEGAARGARVFREACVRCHDAADGSGPPVPAARVGTDANLAHGTARGTGLYRPSPLVRVADAGPYLHDGSVATLEDLLGTQRFEPGYDGPRGREAVPGHAFGTTLDPDARGDLIAYLRTL